uniref:RING-type E3 ubiquitin transferase n=1 Tax=Globisporangium ultimum (strain ATCC 200006 / CBS 805.95 / DAOM BR144) TaxID=431595 RepID=K3WYP3_GLOUD
MRRSDVPRRGARRGGGNRQQAVVSVAAPSVHRQQVAPSSSESEDDQREQEERWATEWDYGSIRANARSNSHQWDPYASEDDEDESASDDYDGYDSDDYYTDFANYRGAEFNYGYAPPRTVRSSTTRSNQNSHNSARNAAPEPKKTPPPPPVLCRFFVLGKCRYGSHCTFSHDIPAVATECEMNEEDSLSAAAALVDCPYFLRGNCKYGQHCRLRHTEPPPSASSSRGTVVPVSSNQANGASGGTGEYTCGVCFDDVVEAGKHFGLLSCDHCFCLDCLRSWRQSKDMEAEVTRSCPACRVPSNYIVPSLTFCTGAEKQKVVDAYKSHLSVRACKYFNGCIGSCPFGPHCFYAHRNSEGEDIKHLDRPRRASKHRNNRGGGNSGLPSSESLSSLLANYGSLFRFLESLDWDEYGDYDVEMDSGWE